MKAIVVKQPHATLIALGVKTIFDCSGPPNGPMRPDGVRGLPGCTLERGERVAIVAGAMRPTMIHEWDDEPTSLLVEANESPWLWSEWDDGRGGSWRWWSGPLGAVVCTVTVDDALPIVAWDEVGPPGTTDTTPVIELDTHSEPGQTWLTLHPRGGCEGSEEPLDSQLPLGDFTPGRWGWLLGDVQPCVPVPCKGRQGVFVLPDDVAEGVR